MAKNESKMNQIGPKAGNTGEQTMRAVVLNNFDGFETLQIAHIDLPEPASGQLLVRVHAAGVNPSDIVVAAGGLQQMFPLDLPTVAGGEMAGVVVAVPGDETGWQVGDAVHGLTGISGAFADYAIIPATSVVRKPVDMGFVAAAALPVAAATATAALDKGEVSQGTRVVVHAAAGGVGSIIVQIAKARGAHVTALASTGNLDFVSSLGADVVVDRTTGAEAEIRDVDVVIDAYGLPAVERSWSMLRRGGILVSLSAEPSAHTAAEHGVSAYRIFGNPDRSTLEAVDVLFEAGKLTPHIMRTFPLEQAVEALRLVNTGSARGKVVLDLKG